MNLSRRSLFAAGGGLAALATLSGCGDNSGLSGASESPSSGSNGGGEVTLQQWYHEYGEDGVQDAVKRYAADYPNATVNVKWTPGDYGSILAAQLLTDDVPDVFEAEQGGTIDMIRAGQLADLTDIMDPVKDQFNPAVIKRFFFEDKIYAIPQTIDMQLLYYRKSILEKAGVQPPSTFEDLAAAAKAITDQGDPGFFAGNDGGVGVLGTLLIWASGHLQLNEERTEAAFLTPEFYDAVRAYADFYNSGAVVQAASNEWFVGDAFVNEEASMQWAGLWSLPQILDAHGDDVGVLPFPAIGPKGQPAVPFGAFGACVAAEGKNVEAAKEFIKWLWIDQEDKQLDFSDAYGTHIPAKLALTKKATQVGSGPGAEAAQFVTDHGFANDIMWSGSLGEAFGAAISNSVRDGKDPEQEFSSFADLTKQELENV